MPRKRAVSFAGFFSKLLPSHRPEQGRTLRDENHRGDSAYLDLGIKPEELTAWNVAEDISPHRRAELTLQAQERVASPGPQVSTLNLGKANIRRRPLSSSQTHALLRSKEKSRQDRRELKASGDFLPVTGCDPWTGEWDVLTPTETLSSDTTSPSVDDQMAKLARDVHEAKKAYDRAKSEQDSATEKASLLKAEARLAKIEKKKSELKQQKRVIRWSRHRKHWSSAAEPVLSPIAQSMNSTGDDTSAVQTRARKTYSAIGHYPPKKPADPLCEGNMPNYGRKHLFNVSDNTTIHTPAGENSNHVTFDSPVAASPDTAVNPAAQQSNKMSFLWVRRRRLKSCASRGTDAATVTSSSMTEMNKKSSSLNALSDLRHFIELKIPDPHLSITPSIEQAPVSPSTSDTSTPFSWPPSVPAKEPRECLAEESTMAMIQLSSGDNRWKDSRCANAATVISSPSISTELMRHHYHSLGSDLSLPVLGLPKGTDTSRSLSDLDRYQRITDSEEKLTGETPISTTTSLLPGQYGRPRPGILESASIPITTIIGCDHSLLNQVDGHIEDGSAVQPTLTHRHAHDQSCRAASFTPKRDATASPYSIIQRDLQSSESSPTTPEIATTSSQDAIRRKSYLQQCFPKTPRICGRCGTEKTSTGSEQKWLIRPELPTARQHQSSVNDDKHYFAEQAAARTMLRSQALAIGNASNQKPTQSRTSGPMQAPYRYIRPGAGSLGRNVQPRKPPTAASADTGAPSNVSGPMQTKKTEATTIPYVILIILVNTMLAIGFAWWNSVQPAFDTQSELRRRRRESASTIGDFGVLLSAGLFCIVGTVVVWYSSGLLKWLVV